MLNSNAPDGRAYLTLIVLSIIWGTSYILIKKSLLFFTPYQVAALRLGISALAFVPLIVHHLRKVRRKDIPLLILVGLTGTGLPSFLYPAAQTHVSSSVAGILSSLTPLFTFILAWLAFGLKVRALQAVGIAVGLGGAILLVLTSGGLDGGQGSNMWYAGLIAIATMCYAVSSNVVKAHFQDTPALTITVVSFFLVGLPALVWSLVDGEVIDIIVNQPDGWWGLGYVTFLALFSTVLASIVFFKLVQRTSAVFSSTVSYLVPVVALLWGLADQETIGLGQISAFILILSGVYLSKGK